MNLGRNPFARSGISPGTMNTSEPSLAPGSLHPHSIRAGVDVETVERQNHTERFLISGCLVVRRDNSFPINLTARSKLTVSSATLVYEEGQNEVALQLGRLSSRNYGSTLQVCADTSNL